MFTFSRIPFYFILLVIVLSGCEKNNDSQEPEFESFQQELDYLAERYVKMGAAIGIIDRSQQQQEFFYGSLSGNNTSPPDAHSVFDIGSITKAFTAALLAKMVLDEKISLDDQVEPYLHDGMVRMPVWNTTTITIEHLVTHTSGLPKRPQGSGLPLPTGYDPEDPYAAYKAEDIYEYLTYHCNLLFEPGTWYSYSNTGVGLLGHILGLVDSSSYMELVTRELFGPLGLSETSLFLTGDQLPHLAPGHDESLDSVKNYHAGDIFQGAGFIKSSLHDMMIFLKAQMGLISSELEDAILMTHQPHFDVGGVTYNDREGYYHLSIGLAWHIDLLPEGQTFYWHGGRTNGYMAYMAFDKDAGTGVVVLCNQSTVDVITGFGEKVLKAVNRYE